MQEIGYAQEHDKRTAKKEAARRAVEFLVHLDTPSQSVSGLETQGGQPPSSGLLFEFLTIFFVLFQAISSYNISSLALEKNYNMIWAPGFQLANCTPLACTWST